MAGYSGIIMNILSSCLAAAGLVILPLAAHAKIERVVEKTFTVQPGGGLTIDTAGGDIRVMPGAVDQVHVIARQKIRANSAAEADKLLEKLELRMELSGNDVTATAKYAKQMPGFHIGSWPPVSVSFEVTVPASYSMTLRTSGGDIVIGNLTGKMSAHTSGGDITLGIINGDVSVHTSGGDIELRESTGLAQLETSGGDIKVGRVFGPAELSTSGGNIKIAAVEGRVHAHTSGGDVTAGIQGALTDDCSLGTSGGNVRVTVDSAVGFNLDASTSGGDVSAAGLTIRIERGGLGKSRLAGAVNGGGPRLKLRTSGGDIEIATR
jgi:hypothetical protein